MVFKGEMYMVSLPSFDQVGSEQYGRRPVIVVQDNSYNRETQYVTVAFMTAKKKPPLPTHVTLDRRDELYARSTVTAEQIITLPERELLQYIARATDEEMSLIDRAMYVNYSVRGQSEDLKQGDIHMAYFRRSKLQYARPVIILQNNSGNHHSGTTIVAPLCNQPKFFTDRHVSLSTGIEERVVLTDQMRTIDQRRLLSKIGHVSANDLALVRAGAYRHLGITERKRVAV